MVAALGGLGGGGAGWSGVGWPARLVAAAVAALAGVGRLVPAAVGARGRFCTYYFFYVNRDAGETHLLMRIELFYG